MQLMACTWAGWSFADGHVAAVSADEELGIASAMQAITHRINSPIRCQLVAPAFHHPDASRPNEGSRRPCSGEIMCGTSLSRAPE